MIVHIYSSKEIASNSAAKMFVDVVNDVQHHNRIPVLGFATGSSPYQFYDDLVLFNQSKKVSFKDAFAFNLDEYVNATGKEEYSYRYYMNKRLYDKTDFNIKKTFVPIGIGDLKNNCILYEKQIKQCGGIDILLLGLGANGHIGFNEPGAKIDSLTNITTLAKRSREDHAKMFFKNKIENVPEQAITMGIKSIMNARQLVLLAWGKHKAEAVKKLVEGNVSNSCPASLMQLHPNAHVFVDEEAASMLHIQEKVHEY